MASDKANRYSGMDNFSPMVSYAPRKNTTSQRLPNILNAPVDTSVLRIVGPWPYGCEANSGRVEMW